MKARALLTSRGWQELMRRERPPALRPIVTAYGATVRETTAARKALDDRLTQRAGADPRIARLESIPGVGRISAQTLVAAVDRIERFPTATKLVAYSGLVASVRASGERVEYGRITKEGRREIRGVWVQAAHAVLAVKAVAARPLQQWCDRIAKRRGKKTALVALARKLLTIAFHLLRDHTTYDPRRVRLAA